MVRSQAFQARAMDFEKYGLPLEFETPAMMRDRAAPPWRFHQHVALNAGTATPEY
jgi:hypothetical protein